MLETILIIIHVFVCLFLIFVVLLQSGQAADLAGAFGGGGSQTALGMRGAATLLQKLTTGSAIVFMLTSLSLGIVGRSETSVIDDIVEPPAVSAPAPQAETPPATPPAGDTGSGQGSGQGGGRDGGRGDGGQGEGGGRDGGQGSGQTGGQDGEPGR
jgi:preprotein translocase subunit SecG